LCLGEHDAETGFLKAAQGSQIWMPNGFRATDCEDIFSFACKLLMRLGKKMLRATDEPCFFFAIRAIMQRAMLCINSHFGILKPGRREADGAAES
jgi:hypothetical protein